MSDRTVAKFGALQDEFSGLDNHLARPASVRVRFAWPDRWWLNLLLLALTILFTTVFGYALQETFQHGRALNEEAWLTGYRLLVHGSPSLWRGVTYSLPVVFILLAHELGHYFLCRRWGIDATLPFFAPSPALLGTFGAFIWIRSPIFRRVQLFDVGVSGPLAGFFALIPILVAGIWNSKVSPGVQNQAIFKFGTPLLLHLVESIRFPGVPASDICLHPLAMAAWAGLLATAINLMPIGQLDGGHIAYALFGERVHRWLSWLVIAGLVLAGFVYQPWWIWAIAMFVFRRHPLIYDAEPVGSGRQFLGVVALLLFLLSFSIVPVVS